MAGRVGFGDEQRCQGCSSVDKDLDGEDEDMAGLRMRDGGIGRLGRIGRCRSDREGKKVRFAEGALRPRGWGSSEQGVRLGWPRREMVHFVSKSSSKNRLES